MYGGPLLKVWFLWFLSHTPDIAVCRERLPQLSRRCCVSTGIGVYWPSVESGATRPICHRETLVIVEQEFKNNDLEAFDANEEKKEQANEAELAAAIAAGDQEGDHHDGPSDSNADSD